MSLVYMNSADCRGPVVSAKSRLCMVVRQGSAALNDEVHSLCISAKCMHFQGSHAIYTCSLMF